MLGKELCAKEFLKFNLNISKLTKSGKLKEVAAEFNHKDEDSLIAGVGFGKISPLQILGKILSQDEISSVYKKQETKLTDVISKLTRTRTQ